MTMDGSIRRIGGQNLEGRFFIIAVPANWTENDPLPQPSADDLWFDRLTDFKAALDCPWIRRPMRFRQWTGLAVDRSRPARIDSVAPLKRASGE